MPRPEHGHDGACKSDQGSASRRGWGEAGSKVLEGASTALGSGMLLGLAGYFYHRYYKSLVLRKMENAFAVGYSSLEQAALNRNDTSYAATSKVLKRKFETDEWITRDEQILIDGIVNGTMQGKYYVLTGEKGTGKTSMLLRAMRKVQGAGVVMLEAHGNLEVFRLRLGKALDYEFHEDYIGSLFSFKDPRDTTPLLDIERAFNKMEKIALRRRKENGRPLVLIVNGLDLLHDDEDGRDLLELMQQRAELWAASHLVNVVFGSNDYWATERLIGKATRLQVVSVRDIAREPAIAALKNFRLKNFREDISLEVLNRVYDKIGGRLTFLSNVAKSSDMLKACDLICERERCWLLSQCWILGANMDDDAENQQKYCVAAMVLAKALVERGRKDGGAGIPQLPLHEARQIMTRADFIKDHDHANIFTIDSDTMVQADSVAMQNAFKDLCNQEGFEEHLQATLRRLNEIESLQRTRELTLKGSWDTGDDIHSRMVASK